jgi:5S rRNA maturation endonuclease (ribonuclease M5)
VHGGDNPTGCRVYYNASMGYWQCFTRGCEKVFRDDTFGFVRGALSRQRYGWVAEGDKVATVNETEKFLSALLSLTPGAEIPQVDKSQREFVTATRIMQVESGPVGKWGRDLVRSRMEIPSKFFKGRGFGDEVLNHFDIGDTKQGPFAGRAVVPIYDHTGRMAVGFSARAIGDMQPKWRHSEGFSRSRVLYNQFVAFREARRSGTIILTEGPCDVWRLWEAGYHNAVALFGVALSDAQQVLLESSGASRVIVFLDDDEAGQIASQKIVAQLSRSFRVIAARAGQGKDPADLSVDEIKQVLGRLK